MDDLQPGRRPPPHHLVGVQLGPAGVGVVEIAPRQHVHPAHPLADHVGDELVDRVAARPGTLPMRPIRVLCAIRVCERRRPTARHSDGADRYPARSDGDVPAHAR